MVFFYPLIVNRLNQSWIRNPKPFQLTYFPFYCHMLLYFLHFSTYHSSHIISNACEFSNHLRIEFGVVIWQRTQFLFSCNKSNYSLFWRKKEGSWSRKMKENNGMYFFTKKTFWVVFVMNCTSFPSIVATRLQNGKKYCFDTFSCHLKSLFYRYKLFSAFT